MSDVTAEEILAELWAAHSKARVGGELGHGVAFQTFYCDTCSTPYPCSVARTLAKYGTRHDYEYLSLRVPVRGESIDANGRSVNIGGHSWAIDGANPTTPPEETPR